VRAWLVILGLVATTGVPAAVAGSALPVLGGCTGSRLVRPSSISFCGDGSFYLTSLTWSRWSPSGAAATGRAHENNCTPSCAFGHFTVYRVEVGLARAVPCSNGRREYTRLYYRFVGPRPPHLSAGRIEVLAPLGIRTHCP